MSEQEWLGCTDPQKMLEFLRGKASDRKLRLFAVECCRRIWHMLVDQRSQHAVKVAEMFADRLASQRERRASYAAVRIYADDFALDEAVAASLHRHSLFAADEGSRWSAIACGAAADAEWTGPDHIEVGLRERYQERSRQAAMLHEIFGPLPFRPLTIDLAWLTPTVRQLAEVIYEDRSFDRLPVLADALEEAGCTNPDILNHCRQPGVHTRGCWALDLVLGKE